ncbi:MAG: DUF1800 family protein [Proteobacteria bacterium]|nr:DUF1800 family protein [Pseudomonadota bacterium]
MNSRDAAVALRRFGLGARPGGLGQVEADPRGFVLSQLGMPAKALIATPLPSGEEILASVQRARIERKEVLETAKKAVASARVPLAPEKGQPKRPGGAADVPKPGRILRDALVADITARITQGVETEAPFLERLVLFWSNHFAVSATKGPVRGLAGAFEREAIRPHVLGRFADMLKAVAQHPAMLIYLDNAQSIGPNSLVGKRRQKGLNENLAREILELHTLGVDGGYTQTDVTNFAKLITGWSVGQVQLVHTVPGRFFYAEPRHEPGGAVVLGKRYAQGGVAEGEAVLADLARHPATARHIAGKLARHFVADQAPAGLVKKIEAAFVKSEGDLKTVATVLVEAPEAWAQAPTKIVPPYDFMLSLARGIGPIEPKLQVHRLAAALGEPTWSPTSPKGWPDDDEAWTGPAAIRERLRIAEFAAKRVPPATDPRALARDLLGGLLSTETAEAIARAETREQGLELLVMSPEFLRR